MADDHHASYAKIGFTVFIGALATVLTLIYIGGVGNRDDESIVETYYDKAVNGLAVGSPVNFRGVKVGKVKEISFLGCIYDETQSTKDAGRIYIAMAINHDLLGDGDMDEAEAKELITGMIGNGLRASVTSNGITGMSRIEMDFFPDEPPVPAYQWRPRHTFVPSRLSLLDSFSDAATKAMNNINRMDFVGVWSNLTRSVESAAKTADSASVMMESRQEDLDKISANLSETLADLKETSAMLRHNPSLIIRENRPRQLEETR